MTMLDPRSARSYRARVRWAIAICNTIFWFGTMIVQLYAFQYDWTFDWFPEVLIIPYTFVWLVSFCLTFYFFERAKK